MAAGIVGLLAILVILVVVRRRSSPARRIARTAVTFEAQRCPHCGRDMEPGFVRAGQGLYWFDRHAPIANLVPVFRALPNTLSFALRQPVLRAWRCSACHRLLVDHGVPLQLLH